MKSSCSARGARAGAAPGRLRWLHRCSGREVVFRASPEGTSQPITAQGMQLARRIMAARLQKLGVSSPTVAVKDGTSWSSIRGPMTRLEQGRPRHHRPAPVLRLRAEPRAADRHPQSAGGALAVPLQLAQGGAKGGGQATARGVLPLQDASQHTRSCKGPAPNIQQLLLPYKGGKQPAGTQVLRVPAGREPVRCAGVQNCPGASGASKGDVVLVLAQAPAGVERQRSRRIGHREDHRPEHRSADRGAAVHGRGLPGVPADHAGRVQPRPRERGRGRTASEPHRPQRSVDHQPVRRAQRDRARRRARGDAVHRLHRSGPLAGDCGKRSDHRAQRGGREQNGLVLQTGSLLYTFEQVALRSSCSQ